MASVDGDSVELRIAEAVEPELFVDEAELGGVTVRTTHRIEPIDSDQRPIVYRMEISGPEADSVGPELVPQISGDFPEVLAALAERAGALKLQFTRAWIEWARLGVRLAAAPLPRDDDADQPPVLIVEDAA
jgi:hypothetical protein